MKPYCVTYVESILREVLVDAAGEEHALDVARLQMENAEHHHATDVWNSDWSAEPAPKSPLVNARCFECGELRK